MDSRQRFYRVEEGETSATIDGNYADVDHLLILQKVWTKCGLSSNGRSLSFSKFCAENR